MYTECIYVQIICSGYVYTQNKDQTITTVFFFEIYLIFFLSTSFLTYSITSYVEKESEKFLEA